jgi:hypothetical protein
MAVPAGHSRISSLVVVVGPTSSSMDRSTDHS